jgi:hypothetical protein
MIVRIKLSKKELGRSLGTQQLRNHVKSHIYQYQLQVVDNQVRVQQGTNRP